MIEGDRGDVMMKDVRFNYSVEELTTNEAKFAINGCGCAPGERPCFRVVVRKGRISVLKVCNGNCGSF